MDWFEPLVLIILLRNLKSCNKETWQLQLQTILRDIEIRIIIEEYGQAGPYSRLLYSRTNLGYKRSYKTLKKHERMCETYNDITFTNTRMSRTVLSNLYYSHFGTRSSNWDVMFPSRVMVEARNCQKSRALNYSTSTSASLIDRYRCPLLHYC